MNTDDVSDVKPSTDGVVPTKDDVDEFGLRSDEFPPDNESVWYLVTQFGDMSKKDMKALSQVSKEGHDAVKPYMTFSEEQFKQFMHKCNGNSFYGDAELEVKELLQLEHQICDLIDLNYSNPEFRAAMSEWIMLMKQENDWAVKKTETNDPAETLDNKAQELVQRAQKSAKLHRPSFRRGVKKVAKAVGGTAMGVGAVLSIPVAVVGIPFMLRKGRGSRSTAFVAPLYFTGMLTLELFKGVSDPNFRNTKKYYEFKRITTNIEQHLLKHQEAAHQQVANSNE